MIDIGNERILIISNNVISDTNNNGKTILSYFDSIDCNQIRQLYFSNEVPSKKEYKYFRISDIDVIKGRFFPSKRGQEIVFDGELENKNLVVNKTGSPPSDFKRLVRELLWVAGWKSTQLLDWLKEYKPTVIFFVGGDCCFAYKIAVAIRELFNARLALYITDDYLMPRKHETIISRIRRSYIRFHFKRCLNKTDVFFTISEVMSNTYETYFGKKSYQIVNMPESLKMDINNRNDITVLTYAGSLYYGRAEVLGILSNEIKRINNKYSDLNVILNIYTNNQLSSAEKNKVIKDKSTKYGGSLNKEELRLALNETNILVFVESFMPEQIEKTKYSLSTKVPEYLSLHKPILAIGPKEIGSMQYLKGVSQSVYDEKMIGQALEELLLSSELQKKLSTLAETKFLQNNDKRVVQQEFINRLIGEHSYF